MRIYKVGGCVRDEILGVPSNDTDYVVVGASRRKMRAKIGPRVGKDFPVFIDLKTGDQYAMARTEKKVAKGEDGFECETDGVTLEQDLSRRDLTINAMAKDEEGNIVDPFNGRHDLRAGILRHIGPAFTEDPVRVLRVAKFAARYGFSVAPETLSLMRSMFMRGQMQNLIGERIWKELWGSMGTQDPARFFEVLDECWAIQHIFPEFYRLHGSMHSPKYHPEGDAWDHTMLAMRRAATEINDPVVVLATAVHDIGKGLTPKSVQPAHHDHETVGVDVFNKMAKRLRIPGKIAKMCKLVIRHHMKFGKLREMRAGSIVSLMYALGFNHKMDNLMMFARACRCDQMGRHLENYSNVGVKEYDYLIECALAARKVEPREFDRDGNPYSGKVVGDLLHQDMAEAVSRVPKPKNSIQLNMTEEWYRKIFDEEEEYGGVITAIDPSLL